MFKVTDLLSGIIKVDSSEQAKTVYKLFLDYDSNFINIIAIDN